MLSEISPPIRTAQIITTDPTRSEVARWRYEPPGSAKAANSAPSATLAYWVPVPKLTVKERATVTTTATRTARVTETDTQSVEVTILTSLRRKVTAPL